MHSDYCNNL